MSERVPGAPRWVGIDLGASAIHTVSLTAATGAAARVVEARAFDSADLEGVVGTVTGAEQIAVDAPDQLSTAPHRGEAWRTPKFRSTRCAEIALGELERIWVPWTTPVDPSVVPGWMHVGFSVWTALRQAGHAPLETYPYGVFRALSGQPLPKKTTRGGLHARIELLRPHIEVPDAIEMWSHDGIDALAAALVARWSTEGRARGVAHHDSGCDSSAIWLPRQQVRRARRDSNPQPSDP